MIKEKRKKCLLAKLDYLNMVIKDNEAERQRAENILESYKGLPEALKPAVFQTYPADKILNRCNIRSNYYQALKDEISEELGGK